MITISSITAAGSAMPRSDVKRFACLTRPLHWPGLVVGPSIASRVASARGRPPLQDSWPQLNVRTGRVPNDSNDFSALNVGETLVKAPAELVRVEILVGAAPAGDHDAGGGDAREPREADQFPGHPHRCVAYGS